MIVSRFFTWRLNPVCLYIVDTQGTKKYEWDMQNYLFFSSYLYNALFFRELYGCYFFKIFQYLFQFLICGR